ncbi:hypothetical protein [Arthrospiribacter ruber]|uniref:Lipoprotein n=1 Tax=Arthrospiribacter ruber TaxID=2487934 RepID=A0A951IVF0_9BACT|nr:hypothetical protein [Arthrospiribacter ruber]MBW3467930.1 hypothetical protein [Arthrospiribacter ruber]
MKFKSIHLLLLLGLVLLGCEKKEETPGIQEGTVRLGTLELQTYHQGNPGARISSGSVWNHVFRNEAKVTFTNRQTGEKYELNYDPNDFSNSSLSMPYADYTYSSEVSGGNYEDFLPFLAQGEFRLNAPTLELKLEAETEYGLITVENNFLETSPILVDNGNFDMNLLGNHYYKYAKSGSQPVLEIIENIFQNTIRRTIEVEAYKHYNYRVKVSDGTGEVIDLQIKDFELIEEELLVNVGPVPASQMPQFLTNLNTELRESSGLAYFNGKIWTINDSGNENIVYQLDESNGATLKSVRINNASNVDWESLAQDDNFLYIGDFGNNSGNRTDLTVYRVEKSKIINEDKVEAEKITFKYSDQTDFTAALNNNNFDCEAFFFANDKLHLFSKNWLDNKTRYYTLSSTPGDHVAELVSEFDSQGLITGADINPVTGDIVMVGYTNAGLSTQCFVWLFSGYADFDIFNGKKSRIVLGSPAVLGQTEAIFLKHDNTGWISSEQISAGGFTVPPKLFGFDYSNFF